VGARLRFERLQHVQLAIPPGGEDACRAFFGDVLGMAELEKPPALAALGGCWFGSDGVEIHLGVDHEFVPARKAHPGIQVTGLGELAEHLKAADVEVQFDDRLPGYRRFYVSDPFGNRIEFLEPSED
jgi:catechol 2,3-dioxygenase-like lactoylglutathione lyase family enzyme